MPSGFQTDNNQLSPGFFRVVINMNNTDAGSQWYKQNDNDGNTTTGRITTWAWDEATSPGDLPQTQVIADALARGNLRFQAIVDMLGMFSDCQILDIENSGYNAATSVDQSTIAFTVKYDRNEFLLPSFVSYAKANFNNGTNGTFTFEGVVYDLYWSSSGQEYTIGTEEDVVKELVYIGASRQNYTKSMRVFQPVEGSDPLIGEGTQRQIEIDRPAASTYYIFDNISVNVIDGTTVTQTYD